MTEITWYKRFHGTAYDPKFDVAADIAGSTHCNALGTWDAILEECSAKDERGTLTGVDLRVIAAGIRLSLDEVKRIWAAFVELGMVAKDRVSKWAKRQGAAAVAAVASATKPRSKHAERQARYMERKKTPPLFAVSGVELPQASSAGVSAPSEASSARVSLTPDIEGEGDSRLIIDQPAPPIGPPAVSQQSEQSGETRAARKRRFPEDWQPTSRDREYARSKGRDDTWIDVQAERFLSHHLARGNVFADFGQAWRTWVLKSAEFGGTAPEGGFRPDRASRRGLAEVARRVLSRADLHGRSVHDMPGPAYRGEHDGWRGQGRRAEALV